MLEEISCFTSNTHFYYLGRKAALVFKMPDNTENDRLLKLTWKFINISVYIRPTANYKTPFIIRGLWM